MVYYLFKAYSNTKNNIVKYCSLPQTCGGCIRFLISLDDPASNTSCSRVTLTDCTVSMEELLTGSTDEAHLKLRVQCTSVRIIWYIFALKQIKTSSIVYLKDQKGVNKLSYSQLLRSVSYSVVPLYLSKTNQKKNKFIFNVESKISILFAQKSL